MNNWIPMYYTSNERDYFSLSTGISNSQNKHKSKEMYPVTQKCTFLPIIFNRSYLNK